LLEKMDPRLTSKCTELSSRGSSSATPCIDGTACAMGFAALPMAPPRPPGACGVAPERLSTGRCAKHATGQISSLTFQASRHRQSKRTRSRRHQPSRPGRTTKGAQRPNTIAQVDTSSGPGSMGQILAGARAVGRQEAPISPWLCSFEGPFPHSNWRGPTTPTARESIALASSRLARPR